MVYVEVVMKYWNKDKQVRVRCWIQVTHPKKYSLMPVQGGWARFNADVPTTELKRWCQLQHSPGKFYHSYGTDSWWFEKHEDAMLFSLRWL